MARAALAVSGPDGFREGAPDGLVGALNRRLVRMALDVHDGPMQELVAAGYALSSLRQRLNDGGSGDAAAITTAVDQISQRLAVVEQGLRAVICSLEHSVESMPLRAAVEGVVAAAQSETRARIELTCTGEMDTATDSQRIALTQVVRESLANAIRHGDPDTIQVRLCGGEHTLRLQVIDDGCGFDTERLADRLPDGRQVGIAGMRERLRLLGGSLTIESRPGGPSTVSAHVERWQPPDSETPEHHRKKRPREIAARQR